MKSTDQPLVGPLQLVVIGFPRDAQFRGDTIRALSDLRGRGVVRIIDALFVRKDDAGHTSASIRDSDLSLTERQKLGAIVGGLFGLATGGDDEDVALAATQAAHAIADDAFGFGVGDLENIKDQIPPGSAALLLLIEHQWALDLKAAVRKTGGVPLLQGFLTPEVVFMVGAEVQAVVEAETTIAAAKAIEGAALLAAMASVQASEMIQQAAVAETARVLIAAGLIEAEATQQVIDTLVAADLIKQEAIAEAQAAVKRAQTEVAALESTQAHTNGSAHDANAPESLPVGSEQS